MQQVALLSVESWRNAPDPTSRALFATAAASGVMAVLRYYVDNDIGEVQKSLHVTFCFRVEDPQPIFGARKCLREAPKALFGVRMSNIGFSGSVILSARKVVRLVQHTQNKAWHACEHGRADDDFFPMIIRQDLPARHVEAARSRRIWRETC